MKKKLTLSNFSKNKSVVDFSIKWTNAAPVGYFVCFERHNIAKEKGAILFSISHSLSPSSVEDKGKFLKKNFLG